eukprot:1159966-Rhodomonas_salina.1
MEVSSLDELPELHEQPSHKRLELCVSQPRVLWCFSLERAAQAGAPELIQLMVHQLMQNHVPAPYNCVNMSGWEQQPSPPRFTTCLELRTGTHLLSGAFGFTMASGTPSVTREVPCNVAGKEASMTTLTRLASGPKIASSDSWKNSWRFLAFFKDESVFSSFCF